MSAPSPKKAPAKNLLEVALEYARKGKPVFPCRPVFEKVRGEEKKPKSPYTKNGFKDASTKPAVIRQWWTKHPKAAIGIPTGKAAGFIVLDVDVKDGAKGLESLACLEAEHGPLPETLEARTPSGGKHLIFNSPTDGTVIKSSTSQIGHGLDIRAEGGYVVVAPSSHIQLDIRGEDKNLILPYQFGDYSWTRRIKPVDAPQWLIALAINGKPKPAPRPSTAPRSNTGASTPYGMKALAGEVEIMRHAGEGTRNDQLNRSACVLGSLVAGGELSQADVEQHLTDAAISTGLSEAETRKTLASGMRAGMNNPRKAPDPGYNIRSACPDEEPAKHLPPPQDYPIEVFPQVLQDVADQAAKAFNVPVSVPACALLSLAGACIGRTRAILIKPGWTEHANLFLAIVAKSGLGKSPCTNAIFKPAKRLEKEWRKEYDEALKKYDEALDAYKKAISSKKETPGPKPVPPKWNQLYVDDATTESISRAMQENPRGIWWMRDELSGLFADLDKYSKSNGGDKARILSGWQSDSWKVNRATKEGKFIPHACLSIFGTIQPEILASVFGGTDIHNGLLPRFLFVRVTRDAPAVWTEASFSLNSETIVEKLVKGLIRFGFDENDDPAIVGIKQEAKRLFHEWFNALASEPWISSDASEELNSKMASQALRLALILHCMEAIFSGRNELEPVTEDTMKKALVLAYWFKAQQTDIWRMAVSQGVFRESSPLEKRVAWAILALEGEITGGMLPTGRIVEKLNEKLDPKFHTNERKVGHTWKKLHCCPVKSY